MEADCYSTPLSILHRVLNDFNGPLDEPHYIIVSEEFLEYMQNLYRTQSFCVRGHYDISNSEVKTTEAFLFPESLWDEGDRPWLDEF